MPSRSAKGFIGLVAGCFGLQLFAACGTAPTAPTAPKPPPVVDAAPPLPPETAPTLSVSVAATPFHVGISGEIRYEVTDVASLASVALSSTDGQSEIRMSMGPAPPVGVMRVTYGHPGAFTVTFTATTMLGTTLRASVLVEVVD